MYKYSEVSTIKYTSIVVGMANTFENSKQVTSVETKGCRYVTDNNDNSVELS